MSLIFVDNSAKDAREETFLVDNGMHFLTLTDYKQEISRKIFKKFHGRFCIWFIWLQCMPHIREHFYEIAWQFLFFYFFNFFLVLFMGKYNKQELLGTDNERRTRCTLMNVVHFWNISLEKIDNNTEQFYQLSSIYHSQHLPAIILCYHLFEMDLSIFYPCWKSRVCFQKRIS